MRRGSRAKGWISRVIRVPPNGQLAAKIKIHGFPVEPHFDQEIKTGFKKRFFAQLAHSAGPTLISYLAEEASDRLEFLLSWDSMDQDLLSLYGPIHIQ